MQTETSDIVNIFVSYSKSYDAINDRYERLVKVSRDITIGSKRLIFLLHRIFEDPNEIQKKVTDSLNQIHTNFFKIADDLQGQPYWRYQRAFSPGIQEYIEAISFFEFIMHRRLITKEEIEKIIETANPKKTVFPIGLEDYLLGISDLTGELMRLCVSAVSSGNFQLCTEVCHFMRRTYHNIQALPTVGVELGKKLDVMATSLEKVEMVNFTIQLRGTEYPKDILKSVIEETFSTHQLEVGDHP